MTIQHIFGALVNVLSIILLGDYDPVNFPDGGLMEDSDFYELAFNIAYCIGTIPGYCSLM